MSDTIDNAAGGRRSATGKHPAVSKGPATVPSRPFQAPRTARASKKSGSGSRAGAESGGLPRSTSATAGSGGLPRCTSAAAGSVGLPRDTSAAGSSGPPQVGSGTGGSGIPPWFPYASSSTTCGSAPARFMFTAGGSGGADSTSPVDGAQSQDEDDDPFGGWNGETFDKANRASSPANTTVFCEICVEEIRAGNRVNGNMTSRGYKNIAEKYYLSTGLRHCRVQLKNRWDQLKGLYSFWLWLNKQTGLGWANGTVVADDDFWKKHTKKHSEWKKLRNGPPENLEHLEQMFEHTAVDGSTSCAPGESTTAGDGDEYDDECDRYQATPTSNNTGATNSNTCATSPVKKGKSPMLKIMRGMWGTMQSSSAISQKVMQGELRAESINKAMRLTVECGAAEGSVEHYMATKLFVKP